MKAILFIIFAFSVPASASPFTREENQILRSILSSIRPIQVADQIYCSMSNGEIPSKNPIVLCGVDYTDKSRWLTQFRTKWISNRVLDLLLKHGECAEVDGWTRPMVKPYRCQLFNVQCSPAGCTAQ